MKCYIEVLRYCLTKVGNLKRTEGEKIVLCECEFHVLKANSKEAY